MPLFGGSKTNVTNQYDTYNVGLQDSAGAIANVGGTVNQQVVDGGLLAAIERVAGDVFAAGERSMDVGRDVLLETIRTGERNFDVVSDLQRDVLDAGVRQTDLVATVLSDAAREQFRASADATEAVLGFSERTLGESTRTVLEGQRDALDFASDAQGRAFDLAGSSIDVVERNAADFLAEARELTDRVLTSANNAGASFLTAVENFQARESNNADARLQDITRTGLIGIFVVAGLGVLAYAWTNSK